MTILIDTDAETGKIKPGKTVGIDLGTTRSCVAHIDNGRATVISNADAELVTPSVVLFDDDGTVLVGKEAKAQAVAAGTRVVRESKRDIGRTDAQWDIDGQTYKPEAIGAFVLKKLKQDAEEKLGEPIVNAVITVPAYFNDSQRAATEAAGVAAGLNVIDILNEPVAAALAYGMDRGGEEGHIVVYDLGGGTFDVSVMKVEQGHLTMIATDGNVELGGKDWDQRIIDLVREEFQKEHGADPCEDLDVAQTLKNDVESAKEVLSRKESTKIICQYEGNKLVVPLTREHFEQLTEDLMSQTENTLAMVVEDTAGITWDQVNKILLVGGSSKMPQVQKMVAECTGKEVNLGDIEPDLCVALGAAYRGFMLEVKAADDGQLPPDKKKEVDDAMNGLLPGQRDAMRRKVTNVTSHAYGIETVREMRGDEPVMMNTIMIEANTSLPVLKTQTFGTAFPNQTEVEVRVLEGESEDVGFCAEAGKGTINQIPPLPQGSPITITLEFTDRGIIEVHAKDDTHGKELHMTLERSGGMSQEELKAMGGLLANAEVE